MGVVDGQSSQNVSEPGAQADASADKKEESPAAVVPDSSTDDFKDDENQLQDQQLDQIEQEQKQLPLVSDKIPFDVIVMEYDSTNGPEFRKKAEELAVVYSDVRQIRGDGNCFYRAVLVGVTELILKDHEEARRFLTVCEGWVDRLLKLGFPDWTTTDFCDYFVSWVKSIINKELKPDQVIPGLNEDHHCNYLIIFLRLISSGYLKEHTEEYEPFIDNGQSLSDYCCSEIEAMWKDVDHLGITGLVSALERPIRVEYMDRSAAPNGGWHYDFPPEQAEAPKIVLLYRPGHYDLIYRKD
ncbi:unnamed protein product [Caenorhabditis auriculariae]|uniref:Ubiquitin thioesterase n=1 Tax=Caenorhabditis auriculariae TaxID=2777116 RepID=A0A8S1GVH5_9PELO|nr:unnamed protein product [Caenorhabditis auriculariae]